MNNEQPFFTPAQTTRMDKHTRKIESDKRLHMVVKACKDGHPVMEVSRFFGYKSNTTMITSLLNGVGFSWHKKSFVESREKTELGNEAAEMWNMILLNKRLGL